MSCSYVATSAPETYIGAVAVGLVLLLRVRVLKLKLLPMQNCCTSKYFILPLFVVYILYTAVYTPCSAAAVLVFGSSSSGMYVDFLLQWYDMFACRRQSKH